MKRYFLWQGEDYKGPLTSEEITEMLTTGQIPRNTPCCEEGGSDWKTVGELGPQSEKDARNPSNTGKHPVSALLLTLCVTTAILSIHLTKPTQEENLTDTELRTARNTYNNLRKARDSARSKYDQVEAEVFPPGWEQQIDSIEDVYSELSAGNLTMRLELELSAKKAQQAAIEQMLTATEEPFEHYKASEQALRNQERKVGGLETQMTRLKKSRNLKTTILYLVTASFLILSFHRPITGIIARASRAQP